jgi:processive 1,2-diacylglycerol beta-glucosyltransferase
MASSKKTVLVISASVGAGHIRAAEGIVQCAKERFPDAVVVHLDAMDYVTPLFRKLYADSYLDLVKRHPALWGYLYDKTDRSARNTPLGKLRRDIQKISSQPLKRAIKVINPDHIICTHFLPAELLDRLKRKKKFSVPVSVVITDYDVHWMWVQKNLDLFFVAHEEMALRLASRGIPADRTCVSGIPVCPAFIHKHHVQAYLDDLGLSAGMFTMLLMAGGFGVSRIDITARSLLNLRDDIQLITLAGKNKKLFTKTQHVAAEFPGRMAAVGFTSTVEQLLAASTVVITKPGGLTTSECLAMGKPMIVINPIPGQEERNTDYLLEHGAAVLAYDEVALEYKLRQLLDDPARLKRMARNAKNLGKPHAGYDIMERVLA